MPICYHVFFVFFLSYLKESDELGPREDDPPNFQLGIPAPVLAVLHARSLTRLRWKRMRMDQMYVLMTEVHSTN